MSNEGSSTAIARSVISEAGTNPASEAITTTESNNSFANAHPDAALREVFHLSGGETDGTRLAAAINVARSDSRPVVMTNGMLHREPIPMRVRRVEL